MTLCCPLRPHITTNYHQTKREIVIYLFFFFKLSLTESLSYSYLEAFQTVCSDPRWKGRKLTHFANMKKIKSTYILYKVSFIIVNITFRSSFVLDEPQQQHEVVSGVELDQTHTFRRVEVVCFMSFARRHSSCCQVTSPEYSTRDLVTEWSSDWLSLPLYLCLWLSFIKTITVSEFNSYCA